MKFWTESRICNNTLLLCNLSYSLWLMPELASYGPPNCLKSLRIPQTLVAIFAPDIYILAAHWYEMSEGWLLSSNSYARLNFFKIPCSALNHVPVPSRCKAIVLFQFFTAGLDVSKCLKYADGVLTAFTCTFSSRPGAWSSHWRLAQSFPIPF